MKITVRYMGQLRLIAGVEREPREVDEKGSLRDLIHERAQCYGKDFRAIVLDEKENLRPSLMVLRNGAAIEKEKPPVLSDGDEICLLPAIAGG